MRSLLEVAEHKADDTHNPAQPQRRSEMRRLFNRVIGFAGFLFALIMSIGTSVRVPPSW